MFFSWEELCLCLYMARFQIFMYSVAVLISSCLFSIKLVSDEQSFHLMSWWMVHSPLFVLDVLDAYFCTIVFIRQIQVHSFKYSIIRLLFSFKRIFLLLGFKLLLCYRLEEKWVINYHEVFLPLFYCLFMLVVRSYRLPLPSPQSSSLS